MDAILRALPASFWAGLFAAAMAFVFSALPRSLPLCFVSGAAGRLTRDLLIANGATNEAAALIAAALVTVLVGVMVMKSETSPIVMASALLPLGAAAPFFRALAGFMRIGMAEEAQRAAAADQLVVNLSTVFTTTLAIAFGVSLAQVVLGISRGLR